jgi:cysteine synthase
LKILPILKFKKTALEIIKAFPDGLDYMITGAGGHITGCAAILKQHYPNLKVFAVEPEASLLLVEVILLLPIQELALDLYLNPQIYLMEPYK